MRSLRVQASGKKADLCFLMDNGINVRQVLALKTEPNSHHGGVQPSFEDLLPSNRVISAESDVTGFQEAD